MNRCINQYDKKVTIERLSGTADAHGHISTIVNANWTIYATAYASVQTKGGREFWKVQQINADVSHVWRCQWSKSLAAATPDMRLTCEGVTYEILSVIDVDLASEEVEIQTRRPVK